MENNNFLGILLFAAVLILMTIFSGANPLNVFIGTLPILLSVLAVYFVMENKYSDSLVWAVPLIFPVIFLIVYLSGTIPLLESMDGKPIFVFDVIVSYLITFFMVAFTFQKRPKSSPPPQVTKQPVDQNKIRQEKKLYEERLAKLKNEEHQKYHSLQKEHDQKQKEYEKHLEMLKQQLSKAKSELQITKQNFSINLRSIEDKAKAINFAIGRVYSDKKGGSAKIREKLNIDRDLYNSFSEISTNFTDKHAVHLLNILEKIYHKLLLLEQQENAVFSLHSAPELPVQREQNGMDRILDVLIKNDKDPVKDYHSEAKEICTKLINFLKNEYAKT